jgi:hypothetical protein
MQQKTNPSLWPLPFQDGIACQSSEQHDIFSEQDRHRISMIHHIDLTLLMFYTDYFPFTLLRALNGMR